MADGPGPGAGLNALEGLYGRIYPRSTRAITHHMPYLRSLAEQSEQAVEFGARGGGSTVALAFAKRLLSVDVQRRSADEGVWAVIEAAKGDGWEFRIASSLEVEIPECDVLLLDSLHSYGHVRAELEMHHAKVRRWIVLHDTETFAEHGQMVPDGRPNPGLPPDPEQPGLRQALQEFVGEHGEWACVRHDSLSSGLTTLERRG